jgi:hypothetical protein
MTLNNVTTILRTNNNESKRLKTVNLTKSSTNSHTQLKEDELCTRFSSAPVLMKYTSYWVHSGNTNREQVL